MKTILLGSITAIILIIIGIGCRNTEHAPISQIKNSIDLDTSKIESALRDFSNLPSGTKGKAKILEKIRDEAVAMGYNEQACYLSLDLARGQSDRGNLDSALYYFNYAEPFCNNPLFDKTMPAVFLAEFGAFFHTLRSDMVSANELYYKALNYLKENNLLKTEVAISLYLFLHETQMKLGQHAQALEYLKEGEKLAIELDHQQGLPAAWGYFGDYYNLKQAYDTAIIYYDKAISREATIWDPNIFTTALLGKADVLIKTEQPSAAIPILEKSITYSRKEVVMHAELASIVELGNAFNKLGRFGETIETVLPALKNKSKEVNSLREKGNKVLIEAYEGIGDYKTALLLQKDLMTWNDSIFNLEKSKALQELELKYQTVNKDKELASKELVIEQQKNKLARKNTVITSILLVSLFIVSMIMFLYKNAVQKRKLKDLEIQSLQRTQEIELLKSTMQGEEQERQRLARELHDGIGSMLSSAIMQLSLLNTSDKKNAPSEKYNEVLQILQQTGSEIRKTAHNMMPDTIYKQTIFEAVKNYCESISKGTSLKIDTQFYGVTGDFSSHCKLVVYRIIQELVHNIVKHSGATHAIVQGVMNDSRFIITVEDNGIGFDPTSSKKGIGLHNVSTRVKSLGGEFQMESAPGKGTTVNIEFDCKQVMAV